MHRPRLLPVLLLPTLCAVLSACAPPQREMPPVGGPAPPTPLQCKAEAAQDAVGQTASAAAVEKARVEAGAQVVRVLKPGQVVTMEFRAGRLGVYVDAANVITRVACG